MLVEAGLTRAEALRTATLNPARYLANDPTSGTVDVGKQADLVILEGNPLDDIANTRRIAAVIARGRLLERPEIDAILEQAATLSARKSIGDTVLSAVARDGAAAAIRLYRELKASQADAYDFGENELNEAGYTLMRQKKVTEAITILELNAEIYPRSAMPSTVSGRRTPPRATGTLP